jgi:uncharacterized membrane protein
MEFSGMIVWMVVFWVGAVALGVWLASLLFPSVPAAPPPRESPGEILRRRYALGELTREEYHAMLSTLLDRTEEPGT